MECLSPELVKIVDFIIDVFQPENKDRIEEPLIAFLETITNKYNFCSSFH
jgi:hypothetical protein